MVCAETLLILVVLLGAAYAVHSRRTMTAKDDVELAMPRVKGK
jgi:hypothetical protein